MKIVLHTQKISNHSLTTVRYGFTAVLGEWLLENMAPCKGSFCITFRGSATMVVKLPPAPSDKYVCICVNTAHTADNNWTLFYWYGYRRNAQKQHCFFSELLTFPLTCEPTMGYFLQIFTAHGCYFHAYSRMQKALSTGWTKKFRPTFKRYNFLNF